MFKKIRSAVKSYPHLFIIVAAILVSLPLDLTNHDKYSHLVLGVTALISTIPLLAGMWQSFRDGSYGLDILAITAIISAVLFKEYWAGIIIVLMLTGGEALEDYAEARASIELTSLLDRAPKMAHVLKGRTEQDIPVSKVQLNDKILVKAGEVVPVDAEIIEGQTSVDESSLTGESLPVHKKVGDSLLSGSINLEGTITVKAVHTSDESQYQQIVKLVTAAASNQSPFVRLADKYSIPFTLFSFMLAGAAWYASGEPVRFLQVLVVATPCPLLLGAPIAMISGMSRAAREGVIIKNGAGLEKLAAAKTVAFDKTGTLTMGKPMVSDFTVFGKNNKSIVIGLAAAVEGKSNHVLAQAVVTYAESKKITIPKAKNVREISGGGLEATVQGKLVRVGTARFLESHGITVSQKGADTHSFIASGDTVIGMITFKDEIRPESKKVLRFLHKLGIKHTLMVTGDNKKTALEVAKQLGIDEVEYECLPADKLRKIEELEHRPVAFVGDGVNDAPVLTAADVGIALGARGSTAASETADVVIMLDDVSKVGSAIAIAKRTIFIAKQSIAIGIAMSVLLMVIFSTGKFKASLGAGLQELVDVAVIINAIRAHSKKPIIIE